VRKAERKQERAAAARYQKQVVAEAKTAREVAKKEKEKKKKKQRQKEWLQLKLETNKRKKLQQLKKLSDYPKDLFYLSARG
jgi:cell division protein FtsL